jgi:LVIVD repeat
MQLKKMFITKGMNEFAFYFILCVLFVFLLFIMFDMLSFYFAYGVQEKSLFFSHQFDISSNNGTSELPQIAVQGSNVYVVWQDNTPGNYDIFFKHSSDNGNSFAPVLNLSNNNGTSELPQIAVQGNNVYVVWQDNTPGNYDIFLTHSSDNGNSFAPVLNLSNNNGTSELPQIAVQGNNVYVAWQDNTPGNYDIFLERSLSNGTEFKDQNLSNNNGTSELPQIAVQGNNVYVAWQDNTPGNYDILFKRSINYGEGFRGVNLKNSNGTSQFPQIAVLGNDVYVAWQDNTPGNYDIFLQRTLSNGTKFKYRNLSNNNGTSEIPQLSVSSNNIYVIWRDNSDTGVHKIFFKHGQKDNATGKIVYSNSYSLNHSGEPAQAKIVTGSEYFYGVWTAYLNKKDVSALEFYPFRLFGDNSGNSIPLTRLSLNESVSNPDIATRDDDAFLVWESTEAGNRDIFFKKLSTNFFERNN